MKNYFMKSNHTKNYISISLKTLFNKENFCFYWLPRTIISIFIIFFYHSFQMPSEGDLAPINFYQIADENLYLTKNIYNPLFSIIYQFINQSFLNTYLQIIIGQLVSSLGALIIIDVFFKNINNYENKNLWIKISKLLTGIHPYLALYAMKFGTENFTILGLAIFINIIDKKNRIFNNSFFNSSLLYILIFVRSQLLPLFIIDVLLKLDFFIKSITKNIIKNKKVYLNLFFIFIIFFIAYQLINFAISQNLEYIEMFINYFKSNQYLITIRDLKEFFCNYKNCSNSFINLASYIFGFFSYTLISIVLLTGARGRLTDLPWQIDIFGFNLSSIKLIESGYHSSEILVNFNQNYFILVVILPLIIFSTFHIIGLINWLIIMKNIDIKICLYVLSLLIIPIIFFPYLRYFIPLITYSCIGNGLIITNFYLNLRRRKSKLSRIV